ncbi:Protein FRG1 homolog [Strongyloides ratti]|uniref:Protein FRG1 homolog n=1 Tax=Strongyloides ratti TaxID=34506 RepID=A0A090N078_STRRB|nr:Protein FRG1 homolog [Strongyloides ratti]CEF70210.1 Protein FRG1 homolog [Strongyloides ratti]
MSSSDYAKVKKGGFKLKGKVSFGIDKKKKKIINKVKEVDHDAESRGGWRRLTLAREIRGGMDVAFECGDYSKRFLYSQDNGKFKIGSVHEDNSPPNPEEVFTIIKAPDDVAFSIKTGYGRYIGVNANKELVATAEAISERERFEIVFENNKTAIQNVASGGFLTMNNDSDNFVMCSSLTAREFEMINIRTNAVFDQKVDYIPTEDTLASADCETSYIKMYQHSRVDLKNKRICVNVQDKSEIEKAKKEGTLHATLLDRRMKTKSDRYC